MKKIIACILCAVISCSGIPASAFDLVEIKPDDSFLTAPGRDIEADKAHLKSIAQSYSDRFVVKEQNFVDVGDIDRFCGELSTPLTLAELDAGKINIDLKHMGNTQYRKHLKDFKILGGLCGYGVEFEPVAYYAIYRNIELVGGYMNYSKVYFDAEAAYWQYVSSLEELTKEVIPFEMRLTLLDRVRELSASMDDDTSFKIFILKDGLVDSMWEGGTTDENS